MALFVVRSLKDWGNHPPNWPLTQKPPEVGETIGQARFGTFGDKPGPGLEACLSLLESRHAVGRSG